jgi:hypothetical protein
MNFTTENGLRNHIANKLDHQRYCWPCRRWFVNDTAIAQHETGDDHRSAEEQEGYLSEQESYIFEQQTAMAAQERAYPAAQQAQVLLIQMCNKLYHIHFIKAH